MSMRAQIEAKLCSKFTPQQLEVIDDSASHAGHAGAPAGGESHFIVKMTSSALKDKSRLERHRAVHAALGPEIISQIHALALELDA